MQCRTLIRVRGITKPVRHAPQMLCSRVVFLSPSGIFDACWSYRSVIFLAPHLATGENSRTSGAHAPNLRLRRGRRNHGRRGPPEMQCVVFCRDQPEGRDPVDHGIETNHRSPAQAEALGSGVAPLGISAGVARLSRTTAGSRERMATASPGSWDIRLSVWTRYSLPSQRTR